MPQKKKINLGKLKRLPSLLIKIFIVLMIVVSFIISANKLMEYNKTKEQTALLLDKRDSLSQSIDELQYYLDAEVDDEYKESMARKQGYYYPDEIIYFVE